MATEWRRTIQKKDSGIAGQRTTIQQRHVRDGDITEAVVHCCSNWLTAPADSPPG